jgi:hypothetical protein
MVVAVDIVTEGMVAVGRWIRKERRVEIKKEMRREKVKEKENEK